MFDNSRDGLSAATLPRTSADAFSRSIGLVVQPGVEFGNHNVIAYDRTKAVALSKLLKEEPQFVFEAHSTDYQGAERLRELVEDGFPTLPFMWLATEASDAGVFLLRVEDFA